MATVSQPIARRAGLRRGRDPNPVLVKELRSRFRGPRAFVALTAFLIFLASWAGLMFWILVDNYSDNIYYGGQSGAAFASEIGPWLFATVAFAELFCMAFVGPALTMNAISGEIERQTYDLLLATPLSGWAILRGKVGAAMTYVLLLIFSALPVMSLAFLFGGVSATEVVASQLSIFVAGLLFLMVGICWSSITRRTARSAVLSYVTVAAICVLPLVIAFIFGQILSYGGMDNFEVLLQVTPIMSIFATISPGTSPAVFWAQATLLHVALAALLYVIAGASIRRVGRGAVLAMLAVAFLFGVWIAWTIAFPPEWLT